MNHHLNSIALVATCHSQSYWPGPAEKVLISAWFLKAREWARKNNRRWFILSPKHGLITPTEHLKPFDVRIEDLTPEQRKQLVDKVALQIKNLNATQLTVLAGESFCRELSKKVEHFERPLAGMSIGKQLHWLDEHNG